MSIHQRMDKRHFAVIQQNANRRIASKTALSIAPDAKLPGTLQGCATRLALDAWRPRDPTPPALTPASLSTLIADLTAALIPADDETYVAALSKLIEFATAFGIPAGDPAAMQRVYREKLSDLPGDLLMRAIVRVTDRWTWGNRMPMPAEIRSAISPEFTYRRTLLSKARVATLKAADCEDARKRNSGERIAPEKWAELRAILSGAAKSNRHPGACPRGPGSQTPTQLETLDPGDKPRDDN